MASCRWAGFPGEIAGASLKHELLVDLVEGFHGFPGEIAGASLKQATGHAILRGRARFPGEIAGASLKPSFAVRPLSSLKGIPRRNRRGLIEALKLTISLVDPYTGFPGEIAGASLKLFLFCPPIADTLKDSPAKSPGPH